MGVTVEVKHDISRIDKFTLEMLKHGPEVIKLFSCSTQLSTKCILLINVKMPTIVDILTFNSMLNTTSGNLKARNFYICRWAYFSSIYLSIFIYSGDHI